jgi:hypothetical protein
LYCYREKHFCRKVEMKVSFDMLEEGTIL